MSSRLIDLQRHPCLRPEAVSDDPVDEFDRGFAPNTSWGELLEYRVVLLTGPAHCGKTSELMLLSSRLRSDDKVCFMLDLGTLYRCTFSDALGADAQRYSTWHSGNAEAVFLLDALDEAELCDDKALLICIGRLSSNLGAQALQRSRFVVSSRPGSWSSSAVLDTIRDALCKPALVFTPVANGQSPATLEVQEERDSIPDARLVFATLPPLTKSQANRLLREVHGVPHPAMVQLQATNLGLGFALHSPGSMKWLAAVMPQLHTGDGRHKVYERAVAELIRMGFERRRIAAGTSEEDVRADIERLCAASFFCRTDLFALRAAPSDAGAVYLFEALPHRGASFEALIQTFPFFIDSGIQRLKLMPAEMQPFLTAKWLAKRLACGEMSVRETLALFVCRSFDGDLVPSKLEVTAGWLASLNEDFCRELVELAPHAVLLYGDLSCVTPLLARLAFDKMIEGLAHGKALLSRSVRLTADDYWQALQPDLVPAVVQALDRLKPVGPAWGFLTRLVASRKCAQAVPAMRRVITSPNASRFALARALDVIGDCGTASELEWAVAALFASGRFTSNVATIALQSLMERSTRLDLFQRVLNSGFVHSSSLTWFTEDLLETHPTIGGATALVQVLVDASAGLDEQPASTATAILAAAITGLLKRADVCGENDIMVLDVLERLRVAEWESHRHRFDDMVELVRKRPTLQQLAIRRLIPELGGSHLWQLVSNNQDLYARATVDDLPTLVTIRSSCGDVELAQGLDDLIASLRGRLSGPTVTSGDPPLAEPIRPVPSDRIEVQSKIGAIESGADLNVLSGLARMLTGGQPRAELHEIDWQELALRYGGDVCEATRVGFGRLWRQQPPREDIDRPNTVYYQTLAGLIGLAGDLKDRRAVEGLSLSELGRALHYSLFEYSPSPPWLAHLIDCYPTECDSFFAEVMSSWKSTPAATAHAKRVLAGMPDAIVKTGVKYRSSVWSYVKGGACTEHHEIEQALSVLCSEENDSKLAPFLRRSTKTIWNKKLPNLELFVSAWLRVDATAALAFLAEAAKQSKRRDDIIKLAAYWSRNRGNPIDVSERDSEVVARQLETLFAVMTIAAPPSGDTHRTGVYSPNARDDAGTFRDSILGMIGSIGGHTAYMAFKRLAVKYGDDLQLAHSLDAHAASAAEQAALPSRWTTGEFVEFARDASATPVSDEAALWRRVGRDTQVAVENIQTGRFHVGGLLKLGTERDMQLWLTRELQLLSRGDYALTREDEQADRTEPDIRALTPKHIVTLELKVADGRTVESLLNDLKCQLKDDYLRDATSNHGIFVVMSQSKQESFRYQKRRLSFAELGRVLEARARQITASTFGKKHVEVVTFVCPSGHSPRNTHRTAPAQGSRTRLPRPGARKPAGS